MELTIWCARAIKTVLAEVGAEFECSSGCKLNVVSDPGLQSAYIKRLQAGETFDVFVFPPGLIDTWIKEGKIVAETRTPIVRAGIGVAVRTGAPKPDVNTVDAFKRALLAAKSIAYLNVGASGVQVADMLKRIGIADTIASKLARPEADMVSQMVATDEIELGLVIATQILTTPGVDLAGMLPAELQSYVTFVGGVSTGSAVPDASRALIRFLTGPVCLPVIKAQGMEPGNMTEK